MIGFSLGHLYNSFGTKKGDQVTKPIILVKICYKLLYVIQVVDKGDFLASADIKAFGCT